MDRKLPALALALALAACAQGAGPTGPDAGVPVVDRVIVPGVFLEENGGTLGSGGSRPDAAGDGGVGSAGGATEVGSATGPSFNTGYAGSGG